MLRLLLLTRFRPGAHYDHRHTIVQSQCHLSNEKVISFAFSWAVPSSHGIIRRVCSPRSRREVDGVSRTEQKNTTATVHGDFLL